MPHSSSRQRIGNRHVRAALIEHRMVEAPSDTPVVLIVGPRRAGKTTLVRKMGRQVGLISLDDQTVLDAAQSDPVGFIRGLDRAIIDEIQRAPDLLLAIKRTVDEDYRPARFLLTGSANVLILPRVADSLAGRMETICETCGLPCPCKLGLIRTSDRADLAAPHPGWRGSLCPDQSRKQRQPMATIAAQLSVGRAIYDALLAP